MIDKKKLFMLVASGALCLSNLSANADSLNLSAGNLVVTPASIPVSHPVSP